MAKFLFRACVVTSAIFFSQLTASAQSICWRDSYGRGAGVVPGDCSSGQDKVGLLCYPKCKAGYTGVVTECHEDCPAGFNENGLYCGKPTKNLTEKCPEGMHNIGVSCKKTIYNRPTETAQCGQGQIYDAGLCYPAVRAGYVGVGPVAWMQCPTSHPFQCGAGCATSQSTCSQGIEGMVSSVLGVAVKIATAVGTGGESVAATEGSVAATESSTLVNVANKLPSGATVESLEQDLQKAAIKEGTQLDPKTAKQMAQATINTKQTGKFNAQSLDPTGIASVVKAFKLPLCTP